MLLLDTESRVFAFGSGTRGELGQGELQAAAERPLRVHVAEEAAFADSVVQLLAGAWHSVALTGEFGL